MSKSNTQIFAEIFNARAEVLAQAPGRLEILGNHTDYNEGFVMSIAVDCNTQVSFRKIDGAVCQVCSPAMDDGIREFVLGAIKEPLTNKDWTNYVRGIVLELKNRNYKINAFQALITSDVPRSAGMSSSASLEMALVTGLAQLFDLNINDQEKALIGQACENNYIGANTGLMDQLTSLSGQKSKILISEYRDMKLAQAELPEDLAFVVLNSNVEHDLSQEYNERRQQCENAVETIAAREAEVKALRDVDLVLLEKYRSRLDSLAYKRALHVVGENTRVLQAKDLLKQKDFKAFGQLLFDSHDSSKNNFENSCSELDDLVEIASQSDMCFGARLSGGGFGGISIHLVNVKQAEEYCAYATEAYQKKTNKISQVFICRSADGAFAHAVESHKESKI